MRGASIRLARLARCDMVHFDELEAVPSSESPQILDCRASNRRRPENCVHTDGSFVHHDKPRYLRPYA
jgi:hypothetical protein